MSGAPEVPSSPNLRRTLFWRRMGRGTVLGLALFLGAGTSSLRAGSDDPLEEAGGDHDSVRAMQAVPAEHRQAIERGLEWLRLRQLPDGSFPTSPEDGGRSRASHDARTAVTALATLAFLGAGHGLHRGPYSENVEKAVRWLIKAQHRAEPAGTEDDGYISFPGDAMSKMHGHGFATLALAEAYGTAGSIDPPAAGTSRRDGGSSEQRDLALRLRESIRRAITLIQRSQSNTGGWGYTPGEGGTMSHEGSVTVCQVQALLAAANRGFSVDMKVIRNGRIYMRKSQSDRTGGFKYKLSEEGFESATYALTAAGVTSLFGLGDYDRTTAVDAGLSFMQSREPNPSPEGTRWFFYGTFYAAQAYHWVGGERWERFWVPMRRRLLNLQQPQPGGPNDISPACWNGRDTSQDLGPVYPTAMVLLMLEVPVGYLSIYAR